MNKNGNTIEQLEQVFWSEPENGSYVMRSCYDLRKKPLEEFTVENLRVMIGQQEGLKYLIPIALKELSKNPLLEADCYEGDLLRAVLNLPPKFWKNHPDWKKEMEQIVRAIPSLPKELKDVSAGWSPC